MFSTNTKEEANNTIRDAKSTVRSAQRDVNAAVNENRSVSDRATDAGRQVRDFVDSASERFGEISEKVTHEVRANPMGASIAALGLGFILGSLLSR